MLLFPLSSPSLPPQEDTVSPVFQAEEPLWPPHMGSPCRLSAHPFALLLAFQGLLAIAGFMTQACNDALKAHRGLGRGGRQRDTHTEAQGSPGKTRSPGVWSLEPGGYLSVHMNWEGLPLLAQFRTGSLSGSGPHLSVSLAVQDGPGSGPATTRKLQLQLAETKCCQSG